MIRTLRFLLVSLALAAAALVACRSSLPSGAFTQRMVILGFDGMDPDLVDRWIQEQRLPNLARLAAGGGLYRLETTHSPESPTAWASFATGVNPGKHNIYDFLVRDLNSYLPDLGMVRSEPARFFLNYFPVAGPRVQSIRGGTSFWVTAGRAGVHSSILTVPVTYPPEDVPNGELLAGLPLPDIRGTMGTFYYFASDLSRYEEGSSEFGGILKRLVFTDGVAETELVGPPDPIVREQVVALRAKGPLDESDRTRLAELTAREDVAIPFTVRRNRHEASPTVTIEIQGHSLDLRPGEWSRWIMLRFRVNLFVSLHGMAQVLLLDAGDDVRVYISPVNWQPANPPLPISSPPRFAGDLYERLGPYRTLGWAEATWPLNEDRMDEQTFMEDLEMAFRDRARVILERIESPDWNLIVGVIEATDRVQHMMWRLIDGRHPMYDPDLAARYGDAIERVYRLCDQFVGEVLDRLEPGTAVLIVSDHGFHSWRKSVNLNTWLVEQGYMSLQARTSSGKRVDGLPGGGEFWENVDWSRTRAYAMGLGQVYFNLRGRERQGIVDPGAEYKALADELSARLLLLDDPDDGTRIVRSVYKRDDIYTGEYLDNAPDLQVGFEEGYRVSWQTTLGGSPAGLVYPNMKKWSGDHGGFDHATTAGVLITSRPVTSDTTRIIDIAPTVLRYFGLAIPADIDGKPIY